MKLIKTITALTLAGAFLAAPAVAFAGDAAKDTKAKPYPLKTCLVSGEKLGKMGDSYSFVQDGQEIRLCCKDCEKDFKKDTAKYMTKLKEEAKKSKKAKKTES